MWISDFSATTIVPDRNMIIADSATDSDTIFIIDPAQLRKVDYQAMRIASLAKTGTADNRQLTWYGGFQVDAAPKIGALVDVDASLAMVA